MKPFFPAVVALVLGIVLGAWQPRGELLEMRAELDALRAEAARSRRGDAARSLRSILRADAPDLAVDGGPRRATATPAEGGATGEAAAGAEAGAPADEGAAAATVPPAPEELQASLRAALDARRAQALAALVEQGGLDDAEADAVDAAMDQMNRELKAEVDAFVAEAVESGEVDRRQLMDFAAETLDIVIAADDRLRQTLPADVYDAVEDGAVDPFSYLSGDTLDGLARLEGVAAPMLEGR